MIAQRQQLPICEICELRRGALMKRLPGIAVNVAACRPCDQAGVVPLEMLVSHTRSIGGMANADSWWVWTVDDTLAYFRIQWATFEAIVDSKQPQSS